MPNLSYIKDTQEIRHTPSAAGHDYSQDYLTFVMLEDGSISCWDDSIFFSADNGQTWATGTTNLHEGDRLLAKGNYIGTSQSSYALFSINARCYIEGNIMSIYDATGFRTRTTFNNSEDCLVWLFCSNSNLVSAENLILPVTSLNVGCYQNMFAECTNLTTAPKILPATTLAYGCYEQMFYGCTSLTAAPELPATTLAGNCYAYMFQGCTSLTTAPDLLASNVSDFDMCYTGMFNGCSSLNYIKCLATGSLGGSYCTMY